MLTMALPPGGPAQDRYTRAQAHQGGMQMNSGNQVTAGGFVLAAGEGQAFWFPGRLTVPNAGGDLRAMPSAGQLLPATDCNCYRAQPPAKRGRACPPVSQVRGAAVIGRRGS
jgi:hypothetical protein